METRGRAQDPEEACAGLACGGVKSVRGVIISTHNCRSVQYAKKRKPKNKAPGGNFTYAERIYSAASREAHSTGVMPSTTTHHARERRAPP